ncbi:MAG: aminotransferase class I/II-fold pyridoxal phosphate-dependent enzyme [bacterium]
MTNHIVGAHALTKHMESNILKTSQEAKAAKAINPAVIDATVGMLNREDGNMFKFTAVDELLKELTDPEMYFYAPVNGSKAFSEGVIDWVFGRSKEAIMKQFHVNVIPTTGGSGAVSNTIYNFNDFGQAILLPNYYWTPYENIAEEANLGVETFRMYDDEYRFNIADFEVKAKALAAKQGRLFFLLNDPCNNPTGLCLTTDHWRQLIKVMNEIAAQDIPVIFLHDIAYIDYQMKPEQESRDVFNAYLDLDPRILAVIAFSGSKTFSMYGFRIGAQIGLSKSPEIMEDFKRVGDYSVRARFSSVSRPAMSVIGKIFSSAKIKTGFVAELAAARNLLEKRIARFSQYAASEGLRTLPYGGGFFIGIETTNKHIFEDLVADGVYVVAMPGLIRVALSSVNVDEIPRLVAILKKHV